MGTRGRAKLQRVKAISVIRKPSGRRRVPATPSVSFPREVVCGPRTKLLECFPAAFPASYTLSALPAVTDSCPSQSTPAAASTTSYSSKVSMYT